MCGSRMFHFASVFWFVAISVIATMLVFPAGLIADDYYWGAPVSGDFSDPSKWAGVSPPPGSGDAAYFDVPGSFFVMFTADQKTEDLFVEKGDVEFRDPGGPLNTYTLTDDAVMDGGALAIGSAGGLPMSLFATDRVTLQNGGTLYVGPNGQITDTHGYVSYNAGSTDSVSVVGGSWTNSSTLYVGLSGDGELSITAGGEVSNTSGYVGRNGGSTGDVTVDGGTWTNSLELRVGFNGNGEMDVLNGGQVNSNVGYIGYSNPSTSTVTVNNGTWTNNMYLRVGYDGDGTLNIKNGGHVSSTIGEIGSNATGVGLVTIVGGGSSFQCSSDLSLGGSNVASGGSGRLDVNGGAVDVQGALKLWGAGELNVSGGELTTASLDNTSGGTLNFNGGQVTVDGGTYGVPVGDYTLSGANDPTLRLINGATQTVSGDTIVAHSINQTATLEVSGGAQLDAVEGYIALGNLTTGHVTVSGGTWNNSGHLRIGYNGTGSLVIDSGGLVTNDSAYIGLQSPSNGSVTVNGGTWTNNDNLFIGGQGDGALEINASGTVTNMKGYIGYNSGTICTATVHGGEWTNSGTLWVGKEGDGTLTINDGGEVSCTYGQIGRDAGGAGLVTVRDPGSSWTCSDVLSIGGSDLVAGGTGQLSVTGGSVDVADTLKLWSGGTLFVIGGQVTTESLDNSEAGTLLLAGGTVTVDGGTLTDPGAVKVDGVSSPVLELVNGAASAVAGSFQVAYGEQGQLDILSGSHADSDSGIIAFQSASTGSVTVNDAVWDLAGSLDVGYGGTGELNVTGGGDVAGLAGSVATNAGSSGVATVSGPGSTWTNSGYMTVGGHGSGELNVSGAGEVSNTTGYVGRYADSISAATIDGGTWTNTSDLYVGYSGRGTLTITNGGQVSNDAGVVGDQINSSGSVTVDGGAWVNSENLTIAKTGSGALNISNGGQVSNDKGYIGDSSHGIGVVTVNAGTWTSSDLLHVGVSGDGTLKVYPGGLVESATSIVGLNSSSSGTVSVDGGTWEHDAVFVGHGGSGAMSIIGGGQVTSTYGLVGVLVGSDGQVAVGSAGSWTVSNDVYLGGSSIDAGGAGWLVVNMGTVDVTGTLKLWSGGTLEVARGQVTVGSLDNSEGGTLVLVGGKVTVDGGTLTAPGIMTLDGHGDPTLEMSNGATSVADALVAGDFVDGVLEVNTGARLDNTTGVLAQSPGSSGAAVIDGGTWGVSALLFVGQAGQAYLDITSGGEVISASGYVGYNIGADGAVVVDNGTWSAGALAVGHSGAGALDIKNGGTVTSSLTEVGRNTMFGNGVVTVGGAGSNLTCSSGLYIGGSDVADGGTGVVTVNSGGLVDVTAGTLKIWKDGTLNINGGTVIAGLLEDGGSTLNFTSGSLTVRGNVDVGPGELLGDNQFINSNKTLVVAQTTTIGFAGTLTLNGGRFSTGSLAGDGAFVFTSGTFSLTEDDLTIGAGGQLGDFVQLGLSQTVNVTGDVNVATSGVLSMDGGLIDGNTLNNSGLVYGGGRISAPLSNASEGEVRSSTGDQLRFTGTGNTNSGRVNIIGGTVEFTDALTNTSSGLITGQGSLIVGGGLSNAGTVALSGGVSHVYGDVDNQAGALVVISGGGTTTFWDDVDNEGEFRTSADTSATFFGSVGGSGAFTGDGTTYFEADLTPGSSPAVVSFEGNVVFGPLANLQIELGGTVRGDEYDALDVGGSLSPGGTLQVRLIDEFVPEIGDTFHILAYGALTGSTFDAVDMPELVGRKAWDTSDLYDSGEISVIGMLDGDTDVDWDVDSVDLDHFVAVFGADGDWHTDFNEDGHVDLADFALLRANFGAGAEAPVAGDESTATPEPATMAILGLGALGLISRRRRRCR